MFVVTYYVYGSKRYESFTDEGYAMDFADVVGGTVERVDD